MHDGVYAKSESRYTSEMEAQGIHHTLLSALRGYSLVELRLLHS